MNNGFYALDETTALAYINGHSLRSQFFKSDDILECFDLADGNVNLVFRVQVAGNPQKSIIVKQALPFARRYPEFKMPLDRARIEVEILNFHNSVAPGVAPQVYHFDPIMYVNIMEDLRGLAIMREGILKQTTYPKFADEVGNFLARALFFSSDFFMPSDEKKKKVASLSNPVLCKVTEDLVYTFPFTEHETNRFPVDLKSEVTNFQKDPAVQRSISKYRLDFMSKAECVVHGDLHTGSIMVSEEKTKVMDPEFGFYGPFAFDIGMLLANIGLGFFSQEAHATSTETRNAYQAVLAHTFTNIWSTFKTGWEKLFLAEAKIEYRSAEFLRSFLTTLEQDVIKHCAAEMTRRTIGMAHVLELDEISDQTTLTSVSKKILSFAQALFQDETKTVAQAAALLKSSL